MEYTSFGCVQTVFQLSFKLECFFIYLNRLSLSGISDPTNNTCSRFSVCTLNNGYPEYFRYPFSNFPLEFSSHEFYYHIKAVCRSAFKMLGFVIRTSTEFKLSSSLKALYCSIIRPLLEYFSILWNHFTAADSSYIELIQRFFCSSALFILSFYLTNCMIIGQ